VPIALVGTFDLLRMNTYHIKSRPLEMRVGEPISTAGMTLRDMEAVSAKVRAAIENLHSGVSGLTLKKEVAVDKERTLRDGIQALDPVLKPYGFQFIFERSGSSSGGPFASGRYVRGDRSLELHFRFTLGLVTYHIDDASLDHESYMRLLGVYGQNSYPDFPTDPLESFASLARDLTNYCSDFLSGDGAEFRRFSDERKNQPSTASKLP